MRTIVFLDNKIKRKEYNTLIEQYADFIFKNTGIKAEFFTHRYDFTDYPTDVDIDGDDVPRPTMLQDMADAVTQKYGDFGADHIITLIHDDNWKSGATKKRKGISGTNYSYKYNNYHLQYVRWWNRAGISQKREMINRLGTINHEQDHSYDALIKVELGIDVNPILGVTHYDRETTHGAHPNYEYVNYKNNANKLKILAPYSIAAYKKRQDQHNEYLKGLNLTVIALLKQIVYYLTKKVNKKNGVPQGT